MKIEQTPSLPYAKENVDRYLTVLSVNTQYKAYSIDDDYNVICGIGTIENDGNYNYHNNYDNSEDALFFTYVNRHKHTIKSMKWWTLNEDEAIKLCQREKKKFVDTLNKTVEKLEQCQS